MSISVAIVDYKLGNVASVANALQRLGCRVSLTADPGIFNKSDAIVLPGVGAFPAAMKQLEKMGLDTEIRELTLEKKKPLLGICLGMQILAEWGHEKEYCRGLGLIPGEVLPLDATAGRKVPNVGWSSVVYDKSCPSIFSRTLDRDAFFFDHSYFFHTDVPHQLATIAFDHRITAAVWKDNIFGVQFHPEKSQISGLRLIRAFLDTTL